MNRPLREAAAQLLASRHHPDRVAAYFNPYHDRRGRFASGPGGAAALKSGIPKMLARSHILLRFNGFQTDGKGTWTRSSYTDQKLHSVNLQKDGGWTYQRYGAGGQPVKQISGQGYRSMRKVLRAHGAIRTSHKARNIGIVMGTYLGLRHGRHIAQHIKNAPRLARFLLANRQNWRDADWKVQCGRKRHTFQRPQTLSAMKMPHIRYEKLLGKQHLIAPCVLMVEGVHAGSHGRIYHSAAELTKAPHLWSGIPITIDHPQLEGQHISANTPHATQYWVGRVYNAKADGKRITGEAWIDVARIKALSPEALQKILDGQPLDVSVGLFSDEDYTTPGKWGDEQYAAVARNHKPDHLALLPNSTGACSWKDGCGIRVNEVQNMNGINNHYNKYHDRRGRFASGPGKAAAIGEVVKFPSRGNVIKLPSKVSKARFNTAMKAWGFQAAGNNQFIKTTRTFKTTTSHKVQLKGARWRYRGNNGNKSKAAEGRGYSKLKQALVAAGALFISAGAGWAARKLLGDKADQFTRRLRPAAWGSKSHKVRSPRDRRTGSDRRVYDFPGTWEI